MNRDAIQNTAIERFDENEKVWIVESPLLPICHGIDDDRDEARDIFDDTLNEMYIAYLEGKSVGDYQRGRPSKGLVDIHVQVKPPVRIALKKLAADKSISQGEAIHFLLAHWEALSMPRKKISGRRTTANKKAG